jgi:hypothetical protein
VVSGVLFGQKYPAFSDAGLRAKVPERDVLGKQPSCSARQKRKGPKPLSSHDYHWCQWCQP